MPLELNGLSWANLEITKWLSKKKQRNCKQIKETSEDYMVNSIKEIVQKRLRKEYK